MATQKTLPVCLRPVQAGSGINRNRVVVVIVVVEEEERSNVNYSLHDTTTSLLKHDYYPACTRNIKEIRLITHYRCRYNYLGSYDMYHTIPYHSLEWFTRLQRWYNALLSWLLLIALGHTSVGVGLDVNWLYVERQATKVDDEINVLYARSTAQ